MNRDPNNKRKLVLRRQTLRTLVSLSDGELQQAAGGSVIYVTGQYVSMDRTGRSATGSANCRL
ncbi:MAG TPA: hypothetical protein VMZ28_20905 [Kofleriaceae bacterium]|nr:hypothetical protein [Kofleriaceae bacterium]